MTELTSSHDDSVTDEISLVPCDGDTIFSQMSCLLLQIQEAVPNGFYLLSPLPSGLQFSSCTVLAGDLMKG